MQNIAARYNGNRCAAVRFLQMIIGLNLGADIPLNPLARDAHVRFRGYVYA